MEAASDTDEPRGAVVAKDARDPDSRVNEAIAEYLTALDAGRALDRSELLARYPDVAAELIECLSDLDRIGRFAEPLQVPRGAHPDRVTPCGEPTTLPLGGHTAMVRIGSPCGRIGDYELLEEVARGGMGIVYKARQRSLNRVVALKLIIAGPFANREDIERFRAEAEAAAGLQHPNIVAIHEVAEFEGQHFFSMDYVDGPHLAALVRESPLPAKQAAAIVKTVAEAIHYAHTKGILHRDLKPSNVLLQAESRVQRAERQQSEGHSVLALSTPHSALRPKITDFGLAKRIEGGSDLTGTGQILGTPSYMPPEQAAAKHDAIGPASDVYSLGAILYELVTSRPPFRASSPLETLLQVLEAEPVSPRLLNRTVPRDLDTICLKCLNKEPRRRYASAADLAADLERFLREEPIRARPIAVPERAWRWCKRRPGWAAMIAVSLTALLLIAAGGLWFNGRLHQQLARTEEKQRELEMALARQVAERLDSDLRQLAAVPRGLAVLLAERHDWTDDQIDAALRDLIDSDVRLFGMCVAFEPFEFQPDRAHFARYICRKAELPDGVELKNLHPPDYPLYREWDWYATAKSSGEAAWTEPYLDRGGGDVPMVTFSVPFARNGRFAGVVTADLSLAYFRQLKTWLDDLQLSRGDYGFVVSQARTLISDANPEYQMGCRIDEFAGSDPAFAQLIEFVRHQRAGAVRGTDLWTGNPARYLTAPVPSTGWSFVAVIPEPHFP